MQVTETEFHAAWTSTGANIPNIGMNVHMTTPPNDRFMVRFTTFHHKISRTQVFPHSEASRLYPCHPKAKAEVSLQRIFDSLDVSNLDCVDDLGYEDERL